MGRNLDSSVWRTVNIIGACAPAGPGDAVVIFVAFSVTLLSKSRNLISATFFGDFYYLVPILMQTHLCHYIGTDVITLFFAFQ